MVGELTGNFLGLVQAHREENIRFFDRFSGKKSNFEGPIITIKGEKGRYHIVKANRLTRNNLE